MTVQIFIILTIIKNNKMKHALPINDNDKENQRRYDQNNECQRRQRRTRLAQITITMNNNLMFRKRQWSDSEDQMLIKAIDQHGAKKWAFIAQFIPNRIGKQCRQRWHNHLNPKINKTQWTESQQWMLFLMHSAYGGKWAKMTRVITERTDNCIKNHWNSIMKKKIPLFENKLKSVLSEQQQIKCSQKQGYLIQKIKLKKYDTQTIHNNQSLNQLSSVEQNHSFMSQIQEISQSPQRLVKSYSQFQVNIAGILPYTTQNLPLKEQKSIQIQNETPQLENNAFMIDQTDKLQPLVHLFSKNQSINENLPNLIFQKRQSSDFEIYGSKIKRHNDSSFLQRSDFYNSPVMKVRYSQIYAQESSVQRQKGSGCKQQQEQANLNILANLMVCEYPEQSKLKRRLSRNISIISPTKFMQRQNSSSFEFKCT